MTCDIDHTIAWQDGGATATNNLAFMCRGHHMLKHHTDWEVVQDETGTLTWTSPTGRVYVDRPPGHVYPPSTPPTRTRTSDSSPAGQPARGETFPVNAQMAARAGRAGRVGSTATATGARQRRETTVRFVSTGTNGSATGYSISDRLTPLERHALTCGCNVPKYHDPDYIAELDELHKQSGRAKRRPEDQPF